MFMKGKIIYQAKDVFMKEEMYFVKGKMCL